MAEQNVTKKAGLFKRAKRFIKETKSELKKAVWPTRQQLFKNTGIILVFIIIVTIILFVLDTAFSGLVSTIQKYFM